MSAIDQYTYTCLGMVECPTPYSLFSHAENDGNGVSLAIYRLEENIPAIESDFQGKRGDILVGGGGGEAPAMRIKIPEALLLYSVGGEFDGELPVYQAYWTPTEAYKIGVGFAQAGWNPNEVLVEAWLTLHVLQFLKQRYPAQFEDFQPEAALEQDGSICRLLTREEDKVWNYKKYRYQE